MNLHEKIIIPLVNSRLVFLVLNSLLAGIIIKIKLISNGVPNRIFWKPMNEFCSDSHGRVLKYFSAAIKYVKCMKLKYICADRNHIIIISAPNHSLFFFLSSSSLKIHVNVMWNSREIHVSSHMILTWFSREKAAANRYVRTTWISRLFFYLGANHLSFSMYYDII